MQRARQDDVGAFRLEADDRRDERRRRAAVQLDLAVELGSIEDRAADDVRVVRSQRVLDGGDVRHGAAHPDDGVGSRPVVEPRKVAGDRRLGLGECLWRDGLGEPERLGVTDRTDGLAEAFVDLVFVPNVNWQLPPPVSKTTSDPVAEADPCLHGAGRRGDSPPRQGSPRSRRRFASRIAVDDRRRVPWRSAGRQCRPKRSPVLRPPWPRRPSPRSHRPSSHGASAAMSPRRSSPSPRRVISARSVSVRQPSGARSATWNFTEFVPTSITANRSGRSIDERREALRVARVQVAVEAELRDRREDRGLILGFDRDRRRRPAVRDHVGDLGRAAVDRVADAALVDVDRAERPGSPATSARNSSSV